MNRFLFLFLIFAHVARATLSVNTVWEISNASGVTANNGASGGFNPSNANMMTDLAATVATGNAPVLTSATYTFVAGDVGNWVYIKSGTNWTPGWYVITGVSAGVATVNGTIGTAVQADATAGFPSPRYKANTVAGVATTASPTGGTFTIDYSQVATVPAANKNTDLASVNGTTNPAAITSVGSPFGPNHVGNIIHITAGTNWTQGWYEIVSVSIVTATLDRAVGTSATLASGTFQTGGTIGLGSSTANQTDDDFFELMTGTNGTGGMRVFWKGTGTDYTNGTALSISASGGTKAPVNIAGYYTLRGDTPTRVGSTDNRPVFNTSTNNLVWGNYFQAYNLSFKTTATGAAIQWGVGSVAQNCKSVNSTTSADKYAFTAGANCIFRNCELVSYRGRSIYSNGQDGLTVDGCWLHDSKWGFVDDGNGQITIINSIFSGNVSGAIQISGAKTVKFTVNNNTLYGRSTPLGVGIDLVTGVDTRTPYIVNNIISGFVTGLQAADVSTGYYNDYNDFYNNTSDVNDTTKIQKGSNSTAVNPSFTSVVQVTGTNATISGSTLTSSGADFTASGVVAGRDYLYLASGTAGPTFGIYGITAVGTTTLTLDIAPGNSATADHVYFITTGQNFAVGSAMKALGWPGQFPGQYTTGYIDQGAAQRQEAGTGGQKSYSF